MLCTQSVALGWYTVSRWDTGNGGVIRLASPTGADGQSLVGRTGVAHTLDTNPICGGEVFDTHQHVLEVVSTGKVWFDSSKNLVEQIAIF